MALWPALLGHQLWPRKRGLGAARRFQDQRRHYSAGGLFHAAEPSHCEATLRDGNHFLAVCPQNASGKLSTLRNKLQELEDKSVTKKPPAEKHALPVACISPVYSQRFSSFLSKLSTLKSCHFSIETARAAGNLQRCATDTADCLRELELSIPRPPSMDGLHILPQTSDCLTDGFSQTILLEGSHRRVETSDIGKVDLVLQKHCPRLLRARDELGSATVVAQSLILPRQMGLFAARRFEAGEVVLTPRQHWQKADCVDKLGAGRLFVVTRVAVFAETSERGREGDGEKCLRKNLRGASRACVSLPSINTVGAFVSCLAHIRCAAFAEGSTFLSSLFSTASGG